MSRHKVKKMCHYLKKENKMSTFKLCFKFKMIYTVKNKGTYVRN